tara:strand:+ start:3149 stop:4261 length:1113 start_codon:yes stop_codon:yes gene_type:complete
MKRTLNFYFPCVEDGGLEKNFFSLINSLAEKNYQINFFTYNADFKSKKLNNKFFLHKKINIIYSNFIPGLKKRFLKYIFCSFQLFLFSLKNHAVIVSFQGNILPIIVAKITKKKIVIRCNTAPSKYINNSFKKSFFKYFYSLSDLILVTSKDFKAEMKKYFNLKSYVHRQTLDIKKIEKQSKTKLQFNFFKKFKGLKIINVGRLTYQKDQMTLIKAFQNLIKFRDSRLLLIGNGKDEIKLKNFIKKNNIQKHIRFIPYTTNPFNYIMMSDVKVLSSRFEGNPNILLEVACLKKLIISTNCKVGPKEILQSGKGGLLFTVGDSNQLLNLLKKLNIDSKENKKRINTCFNFVANNYQKDISMSFLKLIKDIK